MRNESTVVTSKSDRYSKQVRERLSPATQEMEKKETQHYCIAHAHYTLPSPISSNPLPTPQAMLHLSKHLSTILARCGGVTFLTLSKSPLPTSLLPNIVCPSASCNTVVVPGSPLVRIATAVASLQSSLSLICQCTAPCGNSVPAYCGK
jgi:hypothetical protein